MSRQIDNVLPNKLTVYCCARHGLCMRDVLYARYMRNVWLAFVT